MKTIYEEREFLNEFAEFLNAKPILPQKATDEAIYRLVKKDLRPALRKVFAKLGLMELSVGLVTLGICPQFGIGAKTHNEFLHSMHSTAGTFVFYLSCGMFFVLFGAVLSGLILNREEIKAIGKIKYAYFLAYSICAFSIFVAFGAGFFPVVSLAWILGATLGNFIGFETVTRLRQTMI